MKVSNESFIGGFSQLVLEKEFAGVRLPRVSIPQELVKKLGLTERATNTEILIALCREGFATRRKQNKVIAARASDYGDRVKHEISVITKLKFVDYFLIIWDVVHFCKTNNIAVGLGRGCFLPGQKVRLANGNRKNIEEISKSDKVIDAYGAVGEVTDTMEYDIDEDIIDLVFADGSSISCTLDHKILTKNRGWVEAGQLNESDEICKITK